MRTDEQMNEQTSELRATQSMDSVKLSFAIYGLYGLEHHMVEINGDVTMRTDKQTSEYRATQPMDNVRLSFAI